MDLYIIWGGTPLPLHWTWYGKGQMLNAKTKHEMLLQASALSRHTVTSGMLHQSKKITRVHTPMEIGECLIPLKEEVVVKNNNPVYPQATLF
jgi:hypothetical protein